MKELVNTAHYLDIKTDRETDGSYLLNQKQKTVELLETIGLQDAQYHNTCTDRLS